MKKMALFVFNGDPICFIHVLLNALDMNEKGYEAKIVVEGAATQLIPELAKPENQLHNLWKKVRTAGLVAGVCKACARKMGTLDAAVNEGLPLLADIAGHPAMARYRDDGFEIISF
jgi:hypothetical protein